MNAHATSDLPASPDEAPPGSARQGVRPRKEEILDVATTLFAERGYEGTSMNDVAERVGMRKASLFYHFATKDALYEAVLDRIVTQVGSSLSAVYAGQGTLVDRLEAAADATSRAFSERPFVARLLLREAMDWGPIIRGKLLETVMMVLEAGAQFIALGQREGVFVAGEPKQLVLTALGAHILPFAVVQLVEKYAGMDPFSQPFVEARRAAVRAQVRDMIVRKG
ncbi:MAG: TetR/AcrR family transcriptional regulator [Polyangiaceae bacterium]